jgi:hypothetical protein
MHFKSREKELYVWIWIQIPAPASLKYEYERVLEADVFYLKNCALLEFTNLTFAACVWRYYVRPGSCEWIT